MIGYLLLALLLGLGLVGFMRWARGADPATLARVLRILAYGYVFYAWGMVMAQAFNGAGDTVTPTRLNFFFFWCFQIPLAWTLAHRFQLGPDGVFWSVCVAESVLAVLAILVFRRGRWKETTIAADVPTVPGH